MFYDSEYQRPLSNYVGDRKLYLDDKCYNNK